MKRDPQLERTLVEVSTRRAHLGGLDDEFFDAVQAELQKGARNFGEDSWAHGDLERLLNGGIEEGADGAAWLSLASELTILQQVREQLGHEASRAIQEELVQAIAGAVVLWHHGRRALDRLREETSPQAMGVGRGG